MVHSPIGWKKGEFWESFEAKGNSGINSSFLCLSSYTKTRFGRLSQVFEKTN